jgi:hypothetical protein
VTVEQSYYAASDTSRVSGGVASSRKSPLRHTVESAWAQLVESGERVLHEFTRRGPSTRDLGHEFGQGHRSDVHGQRGY